MKSIVCLLLLWSGLVEAESFRDVTGLWGVEHKHSAGRTGNYHLPEIMGSGVAVFDADGDQWLDLAFVGGASKVLTVYRQTQPKQFQRLQTLPLPAFGMGVAVGDMDNDGDDDLLVTTIARDALFLNEAGEFVDVTPRLGPALERWTTSAAFCDLNRDGWLDLYVGGYVAQSDQTCRTGYGARDYCPPNVYAPTDDIIYMNQAGSGFQRIEVAPDGPLPALGVVCEDFNSDGVPDIYVANDGARNLLWLNDGTERVDVALSWGVATNLFGQAEAGMGIAVGDVTGDGRKDIFITHVDRESNTLYARQQNTLFVDASIMTGLAAPSLAFTGFGAALFDIDHDGDLDIAVANGAVRRSQVSSASDFDVIYGQRDHLYERLDDGGFRLASADSDLAHLRLVSRGLVAADLDRDGGLDLVVSAADGPVRILQNVASKKGRWLAVRLFDTAATIGAEVKVGVISRTVSTATSYLSAYSGPLHFGLGDARFLPEVTVTWPDGRVEAFRLDDLDREVTLRKGGGFER